MNNTQTETKKQLTTEERLIALEKANQDLAEQVYSSIQSINVALTEINTKEDYEISELIEEIDDSMTEINKFF